VFQYLKGPTRNLERDFIQGHWNRLPRKVVDASSLAVFTARLDGALSNVV